MATLPVRNLGEVGVVTDVNPYDLPGNAFNRADNVIFDDGRVQRCPVFKSIFQPFMSSQDYTLAGSYNENLNTFNTSGGLNYYDMRFIGSYASTSTGDVIITCDKLGNVRAYPNGDLDDVTPSGTLVNNEEPFTHTQNAGISFIARKGMVPYARKITSDVTYNLMSTGVGSDWPITDTCAVIRSFLDYAIALNVTKGSNEYPTMVKWSDAIQFGTSTNQIVWDATQTTNNAGENTLADIKTELLDGLPLGNFFVIYSEDQVWLMEYTGTSLMFNFRRLFPTGGIINTNCVVEVEGQHFVFGQDDIYIHDGSTKKSIADGRVRRAIFDTLDRNSKHRFFVSHDTQNNLVYFSYVSKESNIGFPNSVFCNRAAVFNYRNNTWSFMDLPNIVGAAEASIALTDYLYRDLGSSYALYNTSYASFEQSSPRFMAALGVLDPANGLTESRVYALDLSYQGVVSLPASPETYRKAYLERSYIDLAEPEGGIKDYKTIREIVPQLKFFNSGGVMTFRLGASDLHTKPVVWYTSYDFNPEVDYKITSKAAGRYLAYSAELDSIEGFEFSGFDADVMPISRR
jgi:hypothetical protein